MHDFYALRLGGDDNGARALLAAGALSAVGQGLPDIRPATGSFCSYRWEQNGPDSFEVVVCRLVIDASARRVEVTEWTEHLRTASRGAGAEIDSFQVTAPAVVVQGRISP